MKSKFVMIVTVLLACLCAGLFAACKEEDKGADGHTHSLVYREGESATCLAEGEAAGWWCEECGRLFADEAGTKEIDPVLEQYKDRLGESGEVRV